MSYRVNYDDLMECNNSLRDDLLLATWDNLISETSSMKEISLYLNILDHNVNELSWPFQANNNFNDVEWSIKRQLHTSSWIINNTTRQTRMFMKLV
jgi:hypothetical protein